MWQPALGVTKETHFNPDFFLVPMGSLRSV